ncbi:MAG: FG-GAP-like repeat-containing protein [Myxococcota bacterium]
MSYRSVCALLLVFTACSSPKADVDAAVDAATDAGIVPADAGTGRSLPWVDLLPWRGEPSHIQLHDLDRDGYDDVVTLVGLSRLGAERLGVEEGSVALGVAWGDPVAPFRARSYVALPGGAVGPNGRSSPRDTSSHLFAPLDWDEDGRVDLVFATAVVFVEEERRFRVTPLDGDRFDAPVVAHEGVIYRGGTDGIVARCDREGCEPLPGQAPCPEELDCRIHELELADFDQDGRVDLLAGRTPVEEPFQTMGRLWSDVAGDALPMDLEGGPNQADYEVGDLDGDGFPDLVAQVNEFITDFPSNTEVWLSGVVERECVREVGGFCLVQTLANHDNHTDNMSLADVDGDGCLDLARIGVDTGRISLARGNCDGTFAEAELLPGPFGTVGIQWEDVDRDGRSEWVVRSDDQLHFLDARALRAGCDPVRTPVELFFDRGSLARVYVTVGLDGEDVPFLLDTGSSLSFLDLDTGENFVPDVADLAIGCRTRRIPGRTTALDETSGGAAVLGTLGAEELLAGPSILDLRSARIARVSSETVDAFAVDATVMDFEDVVGHVILRVEVDGQSLRFLLDTGAAHTLWLGEEGQPGDVPVRTTDAAGEPLDLFLGSVSLQLGDEGARRVPVLRAPRFPLFEEVVRALGGDIHGLIGLSAIERRALTFRPSENRLWASEVD